MTALPRPRPFSARWRRAARVPALALLAAVASAWPAAAQPVTAAVDTGASTLAYTGSHALHRWTGTSHHLLGTLTLDLDAPERSEITLAAPVESFDSGNGQRDRKMREAVDADRYPEVRFVSESVAVERWRRTADGYDGAWRVRGRLTFHGRTHAVEVPATVRVRGGRFEAEAAFSLSLDRFGVERPRLVSRVRDTLRLDGTVRADLPAATASR